MILKESVEEENTAALSGFCKWSIWSALVLNAYSMRESPDKWAGLAQDTEYVTLPEACRRFSVDAEVFSSECGMGFQEHYIINSSGVIELKAECTYGEYYIRDYDTKKEAEKDLGLAITDKEWEDEDNDYVCRGGFDWEFCI